jgi:hypothetical protein
MINTERLKTVVPFASRRFTFETVTRALSKLSAVRGPDAEGFWLAMLASSDPETAALVYEQGVEAREAEAQARR